MDKIQEIIEDVDVDIKKRDIFFAWQLDEKFRILHISDNIEKILGYRVDEVLRSEFTDYMLKQEGKYFIKELKDLDGLARNEFSITTIFKRKDKTHVVLETRGKTMYSEENKIAGFEGLTFYK